MDDARKKPHPEGLQIILGGRDPGDRRGHRAPDQILAAVYVLRVNVVIDVLVLGPGPYL